MGDLADAGESYTRLLSGFCVHVCSSDLAQGVCFLSILPYFLCSLKSNFQGLQGFVSFASLHLLASAPPAMV